MSGREWQPRQRTLNVVRNTQIIGPIRLAHRMIGAVGGSAVSVTVKAARSYSHDLRLGSVGQSVGTTLHHTNATGPQHT